MRIAFVEDDHQLRKSVSRGLEEAGYTVDHAATGEQILALVAAHEGRWASPATRLTRGRAHEALLSTADAIKADLIVLGVHGRNAVDMMLFGSTTNQVIRRSTCPVLTLCR